MTRARVIPHPKRAVIKRNRVYETAFDRHPTDPEQCLLVRRQIGNWDWQKVEMPTRLSKLKGQTIEVWKKAYRTGRRTSGESPYVLIKLSVHRNALRRQPKNDKCRASSATVISIHPMETRVSYATGMPAITNVVYEKRRLKRAKSSYDAMVYEVGQKVRPKFAFDLRNLECGSGIHFFLTQKEALEYSL